MDKNEAIDRVLEWCEQTYQSDEFQAMMAYADDIYGLGNWDVHTDFADDSNEVTFACVPHPGIEPDLTEE